MPPDTCLEMIHRLQSAEGHLRAVILMVEAEKPCCEILAQLGAVKSALNAVSNDIVLHEVRQNIVLMLEDPCIANRQEAEERLLNLYHFSW